MKKNNKCVICGNELTSIQMPNGAKICLVCAKDIHLAYHVSKAIRPKKV